MIWPSTEQISAAGNIPLVIALVFLAGLSVIAGVLVGLGALKIMEKLTTAIDGVKNAFNSLKDTTSAKSDDLEDMIEDVQDDVSTVKANDIEMMKALSALQQATSNLNQQNERLAAAAEETASRRQTELLEEARASRAAAEGVAGLVQQLQQQIEAGVKLPPAEELLDGLRTLMQGLGAEIKAAAASEVDRLGKEVLLLLQNGQKIMIEAVKENRRLDNAAKQSHAEGSDLNPPALGSGGLRLASGGGPIRDTTAIRDEFQRRAERIRGDTGKLDAGAVDPKRNPGA